MAHFTATQGRYLAFIHAYTARHGYPPAEAEITAALLVSPPSVNQMVKRLEKKGLISRRPATPRSIRVLVPESELPPWSGKHGACSTSSGPAAKAAAGAWAQAVSPSPPANLYVLSIYLMGGTVAVSQSLLSEEHSFKQGSS
jgi:SOS-response transcriptional repressor LexA